MFSLFLVKFNKLGFSASLLVLFFGLFFANFSVFFPLPPEIFLLKPLGAYHLHHDLLLPVVHNKNGLILKSKKGPFEHLDVESCNSQCIETMKVFVRQLIGENLGVLQQEEPHDQLRKLKQYSNILHTVNVNYLLTNAAFIHAGLTIR